MLDPSKSLVSDQKTLSVFDQEDVSTWGGAQPRLCSILPKSFCWDNDFSTLDPTPPYVAFLKVLGYDPDCDLSFKFLGYHRYTCENPKCHIEDIFFPVIRCGRYHPHRSFKHVSRVVGRVMDKVRFVQKYAPADCLINLDLTCPAWVSERAEDPSIITRLRRAVNRFLTNLRKECFYDKKSQLGGFYCVHTWATTHPLNKHLHVHLSIFNVAFNSREKTFHRFKPMLDHLKIKRAWRKSLRSAGFWDSPDESSLPDCYARYVKLSDAPRLIHRLRYVFRKPITDLNRNLTKENTTGFDDVWAIRLLNFTPRQVQLGFMLKLKALGYVCSKSFSELCPACGQPMRLDVIYHTPPCPPFGRPPPPLKTTRFYPGNFPELPHLVRLRGEWVYADPPAVSTESER